VDNRRGFLATLGKLAAAVGITTAAATVSAKGLDDIGDPTPPTHKTYKTPSFDGGALSPTLKRVRAQWASNSHTTPREFNRAQAAINDMTNAYMDNMKVQGNPQMIVSIDQWQAIMKAQQRERLDPYKWGEVFDLKWIPFKPMMNMEAYEGMWEARVRHEFQHWFKDEIFRVNVMISTHEMKFAMNQNDHASNAHMISRYKDNAYRKIVDELQRVIRLEAGPEQLYAEMADHPAIRDLNKINGLAD